MPCMDPPACPLTPCARSEVLATAQALSVDLTDRINGRAVESLALTAAVETACVLLNVFAAWAEQGLGLAPLEAGQAACALAPVLLGGKAVLVGTMSAVPRRAADDPTGAATALQLTRLAAAVNSQLSAANDVLLMLTRAGQAQGWQTFAAAAAQPALVLRWLDAATEALAVLLADPRGACSRPAAGSRCGGGARLPACGALEKAALSRSVHVVSTVSGPIPPRAAGSELVTPAHLARFVGVLSGLLGRPVFDGLHRALAASPPSQREALVDLLLGPLLERAAAGEAASAGGAWVEERVPPRPGAAPALVLHIDSPACGEAGAERPRGLRRQSPRRCPASFLPASAHARAPRRPRRHPRKHRHRAVVGRRRHHAANAAGRHPQPLAPARRCAACPAARCRRPAPAAGGAAGGHAWGRVGADGEMGRGGRRLTRRAPVNLPCIGRCMCAGANQRSRQQASRPPAADPPTHPRTLHCQLGKAAGLLAMVAYQASSDPDTDNAGQLVASSPLRGPRAAALKRDQHAAAWQLLRLLPHWAALVRNAAADAALPPGEVAGLLRSTHLALLLLQDQADAPTSAQQCATLVAATAAWTRLQPLLLRLGARWRELGPVMPGHDGAGAPPIRIAGLVCQVRCCPHGRLAARLAACLDGRLVAWLAAWWVRRCMGGRTTPAAGKEQTASGRQLALAHSVHHPRTCDADPPV